MPDPTDRETYEADPRLCEVCGEPFMAPDTATRLCTGCDEWSDLEGLMF